MRRELGELRHGEVRNVLSLKDVLVAGAVASQNPLLAVRIQQRLRVRPDVVVEILKISFVLGSKTVRAVVMVAEAAVERIVVQDVRAERGEAAGADGREACRGL